MAIIKGGTFSIGVSHKEVVSWVRKAASGTEFRADTGLYLRRNAAGAFWVYRYLSPVTGKQVRANLWADDPRGMLGFPDASLDEARLRAGNLRAAIAQGVDPVLKAEEDRAALALADEAARASHGEAARLAEVEAARRLTVRQLFDRWCATDLKPTVQADGTRSGRKDSGAYVLAQFERHVFPKLGCLYAKEVHKAEWLAVIDAQKAKGQLRTAAVLLGDIRQMLLFALDRELIDTDPLATVKKARHVGKTKERTRTLSEDELRALAAALPAARLSERSMAAIWLVVSTGARIGEAMGAVWKDALPADQNALQSKVAELQTLGTSDSDGLKVGIVDLAAGTWYLSDSKNQRSHTIHLSTFAIAQFKKLEALRVKLPELDEHSPWVFPARDAARPVCVKSFGKQLADRQRPPERRMAGRSLHTETLKLPGGRWTAHDLRRTTGTLMAKLRISGDVIDECLNHMIESAVRRTYIQDRREEEQATAFDALGARLSEILGIGHPASNVIRLHAAA